ncbi:MAG: ABC transporter ATP-binding protein [Dehalococcoidia bacterium]
MIEARGVSKRYNSRSKPLLALDGVDLRVARGEFVAIMGPSGCGKSTLLHILGGLDRPTGGEVMLDGERVDQLSERAWAVRRRRQVGYVFQFFNLIANLSAADNVELPALMAGVSGGDARRRREALLSELGIESRGRAMPSEMSGGEQQRVALARALINEPDVLLADEPTGNLDSEAADDVLVRLRRSHEAGQTIVMVTHDARVAAAADRVIRMRDARSRSSLPTPTAAMRGCSPVARTWRPWPAARG